MTSESKLPLALACGVDGLRTLARGRPARRTLLLGWGGGVAALVVLFVVIGGRSGMFTSWMPYLQYGAMFQEAGIGPDNLRGERPAVDAG